MAHVARQVVQPRQASLIPERVHGLKRLPPQSRGARSIVGVETTTSRVSAAISSATGARVPGRRRAGPEAAFPEDAESIREGCACDLPASRLAVQQRVDDARHPVPRVFLLAS